ncbi:MAG: cupin domain-containing protein [Clostridia bacterium]
MNIFEVATGTKDEEILEILAENSSGRIERIVSKGQTSSWYEQDEDEYVFVLEGEGKLELADGEEVSLKKGEMLLLKAHQKHRVAYTSIEPPCIWLCVFFTNQPAEG